MVATLASATAARLLAAWISVSLKGSVLIVVAWIVDARDSAWLGSHATRDMDVGAGRNAGASRSRRARSGHRARRTARHSFAADAPRSNSVRRVGGSACPPSVTRTRESIGTARRDERAPMRQLESVAPPTPADRASRLEAWLSFALIAGVALLVVRAVAGGIPAFDVDAARARRSRRRLAVARAATGERHGHRASGDAAAERSRLRPHDMGSRLSAGAASRRRRRVDCRSSDNRSPARAGAHQATRRIHAVRRTVSVAVVLVQPHCLVRGAADADRARTRLRRLRARCRRARE